MLLGVYHSRRGTETRHANIAFLPFPPYHPFPSPPFLKMPNFLICRKPPLDIAHLQHPAFIPGYAASMLKCMDSSVLPKHPRPAMPIQAYMKTLICIDEILLGDLIATDPCCYSLPSSLALCGVEVDQIRPATKPNSFSAMVVSKAGLAANATE